MNGWIDDPYWLVQSCDEITPRYGIGLKRRKVPPLGSRWVRIASDRPHPVLSARGGWVTTDPNPQIQVMNVRTSIALSWAPLYTRCKGKSPAKCSEVAAIAAFMGLLRNPWNGKDKNDHFTVVNEMQYHKFRRNTNKKCTLDPTKGTSHCTVDGFPKKLSLTGQPRPCLKAPLPDNIYRRTRAPRE